MCPPRKRLKTKTTPDLAHISYKEFHKRQKRPIDYREVSNHVNKKRKLLHADFESKMIAKSAGHIDQEVKLAVNEGSGAFDRVHTSHKRAMVNQIVFCIKCGLYCINKADGLSVQCRGCPTNSFGKAQLKKLLNGRHPVRGATTWPDGSDAHRTYKPIRLDVF